MEGNYNNLFNYKITYSKTRKRTIAFKVVNNELLVISPLKVSKKFLLTLIEKREIWTLNIIKRRENKKEFIEKDKIIFLNQEVPVKVIENKLLKNGGYCDLENNTLNVYISINYDEELLLKTIKEWYKEEARKLFIERVNFLAKQNNFTYKNIAIKEVKTIWGSCTHDNNLTFSFKALKFDLDVIDYLIIHELTHTIHKNHSIRFWKKVEEILPNYAELNNKLKK